MQRYPIGIGGLMEDSEGIIQAITALLAVLLSAFAIFRGRQVGKADEEQREVVETVTEKTHEVISEEAEEDHEEITEALEKTDPSAGVADLFNKRSRYSKRQK